MDPIVYLVGAGLLLALARLAYLERGLLRWVYVSLAIEFLAVLTGATLWYILKGD